jgi:hypothetical protein
MNQDVLDQVLREALVSLEPSQWLRGEGLDAVSGVARRHRGKPFALDPIAVELVEALLGLLLGRSAEGSRPWRRMAAAVAETLCDDPVASERLGALWRQLVKANDE